ncbi:hypothetical protein [Ferruginibacter profundus]
MSDQQFNLVQSKTAVSLQAAANKAGNKTSPIIDNRGNKAVQLKNLHTPAVENVNVLEGKVIQCVPFWKKALTGIGMLGGGIAATAGLTIGSPALALAGSAVFLGSSAYGAYKAYHESDRSNTLASVHHELDQYDPAVNPNVNINPAAAGRSQTAFIMPPGAVAGAPAGPLAGRQYRIDINPANPTGEHLTDPDMIASAVTHEKTHIAVDQSYDTNAGRTTDESPLNITNAEGPAIGTPAGRDTIILQRVNSLKQTVMRDRQVPVQWRQYISNRLSYVQDFANPLMEYDTVINELLHFMAAKGMEADSPTARAITAMAKENLARR